MLGWKEMECWAPGSRGNKIARPAQNKKGNGKFVAGRKVGTSTTYKEKKKARNGGRLGRKWGAFVKSSKGERLAGSKGPR